MPARREIEPLQKVTFNAYKGDFAKLRKYYPSAGAGAILRTLIRNQINKIEAKLNVGIPAGLEVDLEEIMK